MRVLVFTSMIMNNTLVSFLLVIISLLISNQTISINAKDTLNTTQTITDNQTLVSSKGSFELGFFTPSQTSNNLYLGIWYKNITPKTVVWVANREIPLRNTSGNNFLNIVEPGILVLLDDTNNVVWSSETTLKPAKNPILQLLNSGNLIIRESGDDDRPENYAWQSFDYPTDTFLPGMNFGSSYLTTWRTNQDPTPGDITLHLDSTGYPQVIIKRAGSTEFRMGPWNGVFMVGIPNARKDPTFTVGLYKNKNGSFYYREDAVDGSVISRFTLNPTGVGQRLTWVDRTQGWVIYLNIPADNCDKYRLCGAYGSCNIASSPVCGCLERFLPKDPEGWIKADWKNGCVRRRPLNCTDGGEGFLKYSSIKLPDYRNSWYNESMNIEECRVECLRNCSCMGYTSLNISGGGKSGCLLWFGELVDIRVLSADGQDIFIRMASSELGSSRERKIKVLIVSLTVGGTVLLGLSLFLYIWKRKKNESEEGKIERHDENSNKELELPLFDLSTISEATDKFALKNKLGEGGYGPVYKGTLEDGQEVAVKRLSTTSMQGVDEFKNEVACIAKLQHRNLVKLLGCCIQGEEKMLIYEYMPNKSLDLILFDQDKKMYLDWAKRFNIVNGIARGLMYLHQDSCLRIIHRDLKASNILLDSEMNPKISDFGIAKRFKGNETEDRTGRVVGTYGYMSPEYAVHGRYSVKSDVFSFGVLVLEIVSGKRNSASFGGDIHRGLNLLGHAWTLHKEGRSTELVDASCLNKLDNSGQVLRLIHLGLLCVQHRSDDRPSMTSVVGMLTNDMALTQPNHPGFYTEIDAPSTGSNRSSNPISSTNEITITMLDGR